MLKQIATMIYASPEPICFYKVKAHSGIAGNECADAVTPNRWQRRIVWQSS